MGENKSGGHGVIKNAYSLIIKLYPDFFGGPWNVGKMNMDGIGLTDTVEPADSLLHEARGFPGGPKE